MHPHRTAAALRPASLRMFAAAMCAAVCGCTAVPSDGPSAMDLAPAEARDTDVNEGAAPHVLVTLDAAVLAQINASAPRSLARDFKGNWRGSGRQLIGPGDRLTVNIWEPSPDGIFSTAENRQASLAAVVEEDGKIYIPYVGRLPAARRTVEGLRSAIEKGLAGKAVEPQVQVLLEDNQANAVVIMGDVAKPGQLPLPAAGLRLMEAVARAGGTRGPTYETAVTITRGQRSHTLRLSDVVELPGGNIWLWPGDSLLVLHQPRSYSAFGAVGKSGRLAFNAETLSLMEAIAQAGGLNDRRADAGGVFLMRFEDSDLAQWLVSTGRAQGEVAGPLTPVIYRLDFADPGSLFIAHRLAMRDKDLLYVANHPMAELNKFLTSFAAPLLGSARGAAVLTE